MSSPLAPISGPAYGTVKTLCSALGHDSSVIGDSRSWRALSKKTIKHRHDYHRTTGERFPLSYYDPRAQSCAASFLDQNISMFSETPESREMGSLTSPGDNNQILNLLAKLLCTQEYILRRNEYSAERRRLEGEDMFQEGNTRPTESSQHKPAPDNIRWSISSSSSPESTHPREGTEFTEISSDAEEQARISDNISKHLDYIYPMDGFTERLLPSEWLFNSKPCPNEVKIWLFPYLHDNNLYSTHDTVAVRKLSKDLRGRLRVKCNEPEEDKIYERCKNLVSYYTRRWKTDYGFLVDIGASVRRTQQFDREWKAHRSFWLEHCRTIDAEIKPELLSSPQSFKRPADSQELGTSQSNAPIDNMGSKISDAAPDHHIAKKKRPEPIPTPSGASPDRLSSFNSGFESALGQDITRSHSVTASSDERGTPNYEDYPSHLHNTNDPQPETRASVLRSNVDKDVSDPSLGSTQGSLALPLSQPIHSETPQPERRSTPYKLAGQELQNSVEKGPTRAHASSSNEVPQNTLPIELQAALVKVDPTTAKPLRKLWFVIEKRRGIMELKSPLSKDEVFGLALSDLFALICSRSGQSYASVTCLTLRYQWGVREAILLNRSAGEQHWQELKDEMKNNYLNARQEFSKKNKFEVWIKSGDWINAQDEEDEDF